MKSFTTLAAIKNYIFPSLLLIILAFNISIIFFGNSIDDSTRVILALLSSVFAIVLVLFGFRAIGINLRQIQDIDSVATKSSNGILYNRITNINENTQIGRLAWNINDVLDQMEIFTWNR